MHRVLVVYADKRFLQEKRSVTVNPFDPEKEKERCSGSYCQAVSFLVIKDYSISERTG
jgi:hypothetical protein